MYVQVSQTNFCNWFDFYWFMFALCVGEIGDVPKVVQKVPEKVQKNRHDWNKVHAKLFQK